LAGFPAEFRFTYGCPGTVRAHRNGAKAAADYRTALVKQIEAQAEKEIVRTVAVGIMDTAKRIVAALVVDAITQGTLGFRILTQQWEV